MPDIHYYASTHLTESAEFLLSSTLEESPYGHDVPPYTDWWICALLEKRGPMAEDLRPGLNAEDVITRLRHNLETPDGILTISALSLAENAFLSAQERGKDKATDRDVVAAALDYLDFRIKHSGNTEQDTPAPVVTKETKPTPTLDRFGEDLTQLAEQGKLSPILGRAEEIRQVVETLCRAKKRNPALIGPAGVGKTAIVEGLAMRIVSGDVPELLRGCRLISLSAASMVAGANVVGEMEQRLAALLEEAAQDGILLFIDEVHSIMGAGGQQGKNDIASLMKPALARGDIACIVATTDVEYRKHITQDAALERRFNPVLINEISEALTLEILKSFRDTLSSDRSVTVSDEVLEGLIRMAGRFMRNRFFPDKALDLLDHCVASAVTRDKVEVTIEDARTIVQKRVGMPVDTVSGLRSLADSLRDARILDDADAEDIVYRLQTTTEDLDLAPKEPNLALLLHGAAAGIAVDLAGAIAESIFGSRKRLVRIDFSGLSQDIHISALVGSPAGYIGHGDPLPHDPVQQTPWCVVLWENIHLCHEAIRALLSRTMQSGLLEDNRGQTAYFSDVVIIATAGSGDGASGRSTSSIGFEVPNADSDPDRGQDAALRSKLGQAFHDQFDLVISRAGARSSAGETWVADNLLTVTGERYAARGLEIEWDDSFVTWLANHSERPKELKEWEGLLDENLNPALRKILRLNKADRPGKVVVRSRKGRVIVDPKEADGE